MKILRAGVTIFAALVVLSTLVLAGKAAPQLSLPFSLTTSIAPNAGSAYYLPMISRGKQTAATPTPQPTQKPTPLPTPLPTASDDWTQMGHDAQHTGYTPQVVATPWRWKWAWNGPNAQGGVASGKIKLPRNSQPVTGGGRVYIAAGTNGVYALDNATGAPLWNRNPGGEIDSTPAYDAASDSLFVVSSNGQLYRLNAASGQTTGNFNGQATSTLPLPPALFGSRVYFSMGTRVFAVQTSNMGQAWAYDAGSPVDDPPAFSPVTGLVVVASDDLYVHAIRDSNGSRAWRVKPTSLSPGDPGASALNAQVTYGWPVIAEGHGLVMIRYRLNWDTLWKWSPWPTTNAQMRTNLASNPDQQSLYVLRLSDGGVAFMTNVGNGGFGDGGRMDMGPQPVVKRYADGSEVAYEVMRGSNCLNTPCDGRYDSRLGEMMLDSSTVSGFQAGDVRFMQNTFFPTDEQLSLTMSGSDIFGGHWMFGIAHQIIDRSAGRGASSGTPITTSNLPHFITSASNCAFSASHSCPNGLIQDGDARSIPGGFYIYYNQGQVYDQYWRGYSTWIVSGNTIYFASNDGAVIALENGTAPQASLNPQNVAQTTTHAPLVDSPIAYTQAKDYAGSIATVLGEVKFKFNNGKEVLLGFQNPHQGAFAALIPIEDWKNFSVAPDLQFSTGQCVSVRGLIDWFQGDPVIYVRQPGQIQVMQTCGPASPP